MAVVFVLGVLENTKRLLICSPKKKMNYFCSTRGITIVDAGFHRVRRAPKPETGPVAIIGDFVNTTEEMPAGRKFFITFLHFYIRFSCQTDRLCVFSTRYCFLIEWKCGVDHFLGIISQRHFTSTPLPPPFVFIFFYINCFVFFFFCLLKP